MPCAFAFFATAEVESELQLDRSHPHKSGEGRTGHVSGHATKSLLVQRITGGDDSRRADGGRTFTDTQKAYFRGAQGDSATAVSDMKTLSMQLLVSRLTLAMMMGYR